MRFDTVLEQDEDDVWVAECPTLPGWISQGRSRRAALANISDVPTNVSIGIGLETSFKTAHGYLASLRKYGEPVPPSIEESVV